MLWKKRFEIINWLNGEHSVLPVKLIHLLQLSKSEESKKCTDANFSFLEKEIFIVGTMKRKKIEPVQFPDLKYILQIASCKLQGIFSFGSPHSTQRGR